MSGLNRDRGAATAATSKPRPLDRAAAAGDELQRICSTPAQLALRARQASTPTIRSNANNPVECDQSSHARRSGDVRKTCQLGLSNQCQTKAVPDNTLKPPPHVPRHRDRGRENATAAPRRRRRRRFATRQPNARNKFKREPHQGRDRTATAPLARFNGVDGDERQ